MNASYSIILALLMVTANVQSIKFHLEPNTQKCLKQDVEAHVLVLGEYEVSEAIGQKVDYVAKDSKGHLLSQQENVPQGREGKFTFSTETYDTYEICFISHVPQHQRGISQSVKLVAKRGLEAKNYEGIGEAAKLKPIELELKRLEDLSANIVQDFVRMRQREEQMRNTNETTNARVLYFSIFSMCCLLGLATWQVFYLRRFFRAKKLIE